MEDGVGKLTVDEVIVLVGRMVQKLRNKHTATSTSARPTLKFFATTLQQACSILNIDRGARLEQVVPLLESLSSSTALTAGNRAVLQRLPGNLSMFYSMYTEGRMGPHEERLLTPEKAKKKVGAPKGTLEPAPPPRHPVAESDAELVVLLKLAEEERDAALAKLRGVEEQVAIQETLRAAAQARAEKLDEAQLISMRLRQELATLRSTVKDLKKEPAPAVAESAKALAELKEVLEDAESDRKAAEAKLDRLASANSELMRQLTEYKQRVDNANTRGPSAEEKRLLSVLRSVKEIAAGGLSLEFKLQFIQQLIDKEV